MFYMPSAAMFCCILLVYTLPVNFKVSSLALRQIPSRRFATKVSRTIAYPEHYFPNTIDAIGAHADRIGVMLREVSQVIPGMSNRATPMPLLNSKGQYKTIQEFSDDLHNRFGIRYSLGLNIGHILKNAAYSMRTIVLLSEGLIRGIDCSSAEMLYQIGKNVIRTGISEINNIYDVIGQIGAGPELAALRSLTNSVSEYATLLMNIPCELVVRSLSNELHELNLLNTLLSPIEL